MHISSEVYRVSVLVAEYIFGSKLWAGKYTMRAAAYGGPGRLKSKGDYPLWKIKDQTCNCLVVTGAEKMMMPLKATIARSLELF